MANKCESCGRKLGFFNTKYICDMRGCDATICSACLDKANQSDGGWGTCDNCDCTYCGKHFENHPDCEDDSESDGSDDESSEVTTDITEFESKNQLFVIIDFSDREDNGEPYLEDLNELISEYLANGYMIQGYYSEKSEVWMVKKNG
jgi:hypothetical protein